MGREAEPRLHGATDGEGHLLHGGEEDGMGVGSPPRRQEEEARVSSSRSPSAVASDASFRSSGTWSSSSFSSLASNVESDDGDAAYPWTQCEYEEIPSFRWIASPLRWWKPKKGSVLSRKDTAQAPTAIRDEEPRTPAGSRASETYPGLVHFEGYRKFRLDQLLWGKADVLGDNIYWSTYKATLHRGFPLGQNIYWAAYEASFDEGSPVAVRRLPSEVTAEDFVTQVNLIGKIRHSNLLAPRAYYYGTNPEVSGPLIVFVDELDYMQSLSDFIDVKFLQKFLVFDYMPQGSLSKFLQYARGNSSAIDWPTRMNIAIGVARGLHHLHTQGNMVHGNLSSVNVLLDDHVNAKIGGYGISKLLNPVSANSYFNFEETTSTSEYRAPELSNLNKANTKTDVYSLGMIMLELLTMKSPKYFLDRTQPVASIVERYTPNIPEFRDTLKLALKCVDPSPNVRPEMRKVLQQLEEIKSKFEKTTHTPTDAAAASNITRASPATAERTTSPFKDNGIQTPRTSNNFANDGNLPQACASENTISSPLASSASDAEAMPAPIDSCKHKVEILATMTPQGDIKDPEIANPTQEEEITQNTSVDEELDALNPAEHRTGVRADTERCNAMAQGTGASPLSGIDCATVDIQVRLHVPTSPPLITARSLGYRATGRDIGEQTAGDAAEAGRSESLILLDDHVNAKIGGYGISKLLNPVSANSYFNFEETTSTSEYRAPELSNLNKANTKTDVYSLGVIMLELLTGKSPTDFLDRTQRVASIAKRYTPNIPEFRDTLKLALKCVDASPNVRPEMRKVLQQLEEIKSKFEKTTHTPTDAAAASNITRASPATAERTSPFKDNGIRTPRTSNNFPNDGNLPLTCASENTISSPLASSASDAEAMPAPIDSCKHKVENLATMTPQGDIKDPEIANPTHEEEITQNTSVDEELDALNPAEHRTGVRMDTERCNALAQGTWASPLSGIDCAMVDIQVRLHVPTSPPLITARSLGYRATGRDIGEQTAGDAAEAGRSEVKSAGGATAGISPSTTAAAIPTTGSWLGTKSSFLSHSIASSSSFFSACVLMYCSIYLAFLSLYRSSTQTEEFASTESVAPDEITNSPTSQLEGDQDTTYELSGQDHQSAESRRTYRLTNHMSSGSGAEIINPLSTIDWSKLENMEVELQVPSASLLISSEPDLIFQSYFLTLHKLGHTSPPLPFDLLEGHVNRMVVGLHSMGYPLDAWTKAATLLLVSAKKREYIEHCVEDYKAQLEVQDEEFTSAITLAKENFSRIQSNLSALEQRNQELDETIAGFVAYLAGLKLEQEKVVNEMTTARDLLATVEAEAESISIDMDRVKQQRSATSLLRDEMLQQLPPLDEVFDSAFQQIIAKKF